MKIGLIVGSQRKKSNSLKVAHYVQQELQTLVPNLSTYLLDLGNAPLPMWDEGVWAGEERWTRILGPISLELASCDGFVVFSPEYAGMSPAALKNFFLLFGSKELGHKAGLIVSVSSGRGGSYPVMELRSSSYKNSRIGWTPEHVIVRDADHVLNGASIENDGDRFIRGALTYHVKLFAEYVKAFNQVRASGVIDLKTFPNGM